MAMVLKALAIDNNVENDKGFFHNAHQQVFYMVVHKQNAMAQAQLLLKMYADERSQLPYLHHKVGSKYSHDPPNNCKER